MFWLALFLIKYRVTEPIGEIFYTKKLDEADLSSFVKQKGVNIVVFADDLSKCAYMNFAVSKFSDYEFGVASESLGESFGCTEYPCVRPFRSGKEIEKISIAPRTAGTFTLWCETLANPTMVAIKNAEYLRVVLDMPGSCVFGVDISKRPWKLDKDQAFYYAPKKVFADLGVSVEKGIYVYRQADRQLLPVTGDDIMAMTKTTVADLKFLRREDRPFVGGLVLSQDVNESEKEVALMQQLSAEFEKDFYIGILPENWVDEAGLRYIPGPMFVVFDNKAAQPKAKRYLLQKNAHDLESLRSFLSAVAKGELPHTEIVEQNPPEGYLNTHTLKELNPENDAFVIFADKRKSSLRALLICRRIQKLLNSSRIEVYMYNMSQNEPPSFQMTKAPTLMMVNKNGAFTYEVGPFIFRDVFNFMLASVANHYDIPVLDHAAMDREITNEYFDKVKEINEKDDTVYTRKKRYLNN